jgi:PAS domain S-box-containing protein
MTQKLNILHVEDSPDDALLISRFLMKAGYDLTCQRVDTYDAMVQALSEGEWDLVLCDHSMPNIDTSTALEAIAKSDLDLPMIIVSGAIDDRTAVAAMKAGVRDYVMKDSLPRLVPVIERELLARQIRAQKMSVEHSLADQVHFLHELIETIPAPIFYKDINGVYLGCNTIFARWFGKSNADEIKGLNIQAIIPSSSALLHSQKDDELLAVGGKTIYEANLAGPQGELRHYRVHKAAYADARGKPVGVVGILMDITDLKNMEEARRDLEGQLRQAQKLEAIGTLAGGIAHDFNNILAAVSGYSELALTQVGAETKTSQYLEQVLGASARAKELIKQILTFSRKTEQEIQPVNIGLVANEALKLLRATLPPSIEMEISLDTEAGLVSADPTHIHQVFMNLCTNAAHAMEDKEGILRVKTRQVTIPESDIVEKGIKAPGSYLELKIADTGHGMTKINMERIFDPYFTTKAPGEGTGLGLSVVHGIIKSIGGSIDVESERGQGSVFTILMPIVEQEEVQAEKTERVDTHGDERIMVVDDESSIIELLSVQLGKLGYQITAFENGDKAWAHFESNPENFDAVITDLLMPGMQGDKLVEKIKGIKPGIPIMVYSGFSECMLKHDGMKTEADALLLKPTSGTEIAETLRKLLDEKRTP